MTIYALVDCNNFYASCEKVFNPSLANQPVIVLSNNDGCVVARSQEVKDLGIPMGQPVFKIKNLIEKHKIKVFSSNYELYGDMSHRVMTVLGNFATELEIYSIDEAFLHLAGFIKPMEHCQQIKKIIQQWTGLPVSIGIGNTKTLAKVANHYAKKNKLGVFDLTIINVDNLLKNIPVLEIWGIGAQSTKLLNSYGIRTALDLKNAEDNFIRKNLKVTGLRTVYELRGIPCITLEEQPQPRKNITCSRSFGKKITSLAELQQAVAQYVSIAAEKLRTMHLITRKIFIFINTNPFGKDPYYANATTISLPVATSNTLEIIKASVKAVEKIYKDGYFYKKAGVIFLDLLSETSIQLNMFSSVSQERTRQLMRTIDDINSWATKELIYSAAIGKNRDWHMSRRLKSPAYTTRWDDLPIVKVI
jgi:DNA polymerase V